MGMIRRVPLIALLALAVFAAPAAAKVVHYKNIRSPSKLIGCISLKYGGKGIECFAPYLPRRDLDPYYGLEPHGTTDIGERGDYPATRTPRPARSSTATPGCATAS